jgi:hypothetical protein
MRQRQRLAALALVSVALFSGSEARTRVRARSCGTTRSLVRVGGSCGSTRSLSRVGGTGPVTTMSSAVPDPLRREPAGEVLRRILAGALAASTSCALVVASGHVLATKLTADVLSGCLAAFAVSPFVALVDSAVARSVANKSPPQRELWQSLVVLARAPLEGLYRKDFYYTCARLLRLGSSATRRAAPRPCRLERRQLGRAYCVRSTHLCLARPRLLAHVRVRSDVTCTSLPT